MTNPRTAAVLIVGGGARVASFQERRRATCRVLCRRRGHRGYEHFLIAGPDNVFTMAAGPWRWSFRASATLLLFIDALGCLCGIWAGNGARRSAA